MVYDAAGTPRPYYLNVTLDGAHVAGSPFALTLRPNRAAASDTIAHDAKHVLMTQTRPSTAPALVDAVESEAAGPRAGAPQRSTRRVQGDGFARTLTLRPRAHPETRSRLAAVDAAARAAFVRRQRGAE